MGIKKNNPGCNCCDVGCEIECYTDGDVLSSTTASQQNFDVTFPGSGYFQLNPTLSDFVLLGSLGNLDGTYVFLLDESCEFPIGVWVEIDPLPSLTATFYDVNNCFGPGITLTASVTKVEYKLATSTSIEFRFTVLINSTPSASREVTASFGGGGLLRCNGADLVSFARGPNAGPPAGSCTGFDNIPLGWGNVAGEYYFT